MARRRRKKRYHTGTYVSLKTGTEHKYRSEWERGFMAYLDGSDEVTTWSYEQIVIEYVSNVRSKKVRRYYPDFYVKFVDGHEKIVEIKPSRKVNHSIVQKKAAAAQEWCSAHGMLYVILTEHELKFLQVL